MPHHDWSGAGDGALLAAARAGDHGAFAELVRRRQGAVRRLLRQLCASAPDADDLAQETFLRAWNRLGDVRDPAALAGWLRRVAVTAFLQRRRRAVLVVEELEESAAPAPGEDAAGKMDLERALATLSDGERLCVTLHHGEGLSHAEIAAATRLPLGTVKSHIGRGTRRLRERMGMP